MWVVVTLIFIIVVGTMAGVHELRKYEDAAWPVVIMLVFTLWFFGCVAWLSFKFPERDTISWKYKRMMLLRLIPKFLPGWVSSSSHRLMNEDIRKSGLFRDKANHIAREDYLFGPAGKVVAEVYQISLESGSNNEKALGLLESQDNHFYGFFYRVHCPVIFPCDVWVFPRQRKIEGEVDNWAELSEGKYAHSARKNIKTGDTEFDEHFSVYTNDPNRVMEILTERKKEKPRDGRPAFFHRLRILLYRKQVYTMIGFSDDPLDINPEKGNRCNTFASPCGRN